MQNQVAGYGHLRILANFPFLINLREASYHENSNNYFKIPALVMVTPFQYIKERLKMLFQRLFRNFLLILKTARNGSGG